MKGNDGKKPELCEKCGRPHISDICPFIRLRNELLRLGITTLTKFPHFIYRRYYCACSTHPRWHIRAGRGIWECISCGTVR